MYQYMLTPTEDANIMQLIALGVNVSLTVGCALSLSLLVVMYQSALHLLDMLGLVETGDQPVGPKAIEFLLEMAMPVELFSIIRGLILLSCICITAIALFGNFASLKASLNTKFQYAMLVNTSTLLSTMVIAIIIYNLHGMELMAKERFIAAIKTDLLPVNSVSGAHGLQKDLSINIHAIQARMRCCIAENLRDLEDSLWYKSRSANQSIPVTCCPLNQTKVDEIVKSGDWKESWKILEDPHCPTTRIGMHHRLCSSAALKWRIGPIIVILTVLTCLQLAATYFHQAFYELEVQYLEHANLR